VLKDAIGGWYFGLECELSSVFYAAGKYLGFA